MKLKLITLKLKSPILKHFEAKIYIIYINLCKRFSLLWLPFGSFFTLTHSCIINVGVLYQYKATFTQSIFLHQDFYLLKPVFLGKTWKDFEDLLCVRITALILENPHSESDALPDTESKAKIASKEVELRQKAMAAQFDHIENLRA